LPGASLTAEIRSAPGDLAHLPRAWHHHMDDLLRRNGRAETQQPGTSETKQECHKQRNNLKKKEDINGMEEDKRFFTIKLECICKNVKSNIELRIVK
jgi:hypothetical protein